MKRLLLTLLLALLLPMQAWAQLSDTGLVVRYYLDEAASGTGPTVAADSSPNNYALDLFYNSGAMTYIEMSGNRGLDSTTANASQRASRTIATSDALWIAMNGKTKGTLEVVFYVDAYNSNGGRIFGVDNGSTGTDGQFNVLATTTNLLLGWNERANQTLAAVPSTGARHVLHVIIDTSLATQADRVRYSLNGGTITNGSSTSLPPNDALAFESGNDSLVINNRNSGSGFNRSADQKILYAAMYDTPFDQTRVDTHYSVLNADDDTPSAAPSIQFLRRRLQ